jgi:long-chain acyl-CoA synthetase
MIEFSTPLVVPHDPTANATNLLLDRVAASPDNALFSVPNGSGGWNDLSARAFHAQVIALAKGFVAAGIKPGDRVGLMCKTRFEWSLVDFAMWFAGAALVPIYETSSPSQIEWILQDSEAVAIIMETHDHVARFDEARKNTPFVHTAWCLDDGDLAKLVDQGSKVSDEEIERRRSAAKPGDLATLIYTSGSTGKPKGCVLTHANFVDLCRNSTVAISSVVNERASTVLFIPLAHIFARFIAVLAVTGGVKVGHQPDTSQLLPALQSFKPTFLLAVPRVFEKVYNSAEQKAEAGGKGKIFRAAAKVAVEHSRAVEAGKIPLGLKVQFALFDRLVYSKLRDALGGRVEFAVSGSAPLGERLGRFFHSLGFMILEGYGLTETTAPATINRPENFKIGSVGPAMPGVSIRLTNDNEIEVKGINVFDGYWKNPKATKESFDDGWFKTGDIGTFDDEGYLKITGRKKEIIVTASGKNVSPAFLEDPIRSDPLIGQVVVVGDAKPFVAALVTLDPEMLPMWLSNNKLDSGMSLAEAAANPVVIAGVQAAVDRANARVSRAESIRKFTILPIEFTEKSGHLTPKLSIKRNIIHDDFAAQIEDMYGHENLPGD